MFRALLLVALLAAAWAAPADNAAPSTSGFIDLVKRIEKASFFASLPQFEKMVTFEMLAAAETNNLDVILNQLGYYRLLTYLDHLPKDYSHDLITYLKGHLAGGVPSSN